MKYCIFFLFYMLFLSVNAFNNDSIDRCKFIVAYDFITNTEDIDGNPVVDSCQWGVMVGEHSTKCEEFNKIMYFDVKEEKYSDLEFYCRKLNTPTFIVNRVDGSMTVLDRIVPQLYIIEDKIPSIDWKITDGDTLNISGFSCKKATCEYAGRQWNVWYTEQIPIPAGPWKLCGLPGMILKADDGGTHTFTFAGLRNVECNMKLWSRMDPKKIAMDKFIRNRNKVYCDKQYVRNPRFYIPEEALGGAIEMFPGVEAESNPENAQTTIAMDMIVPKKVNAYKPLELK